MYTTYDNLLPTKPYMTATGKWDSIPQKHQSANNALVGKMIAYNGNLYECISSSQTRIVITSTSGDFEVKRIDCKTEGSIFNREAWGKDLETKLGGKVIFKQSKGCQLHGNIDTELYVDGVLTYLIPSNY